MASKIPEMNWGSDNISEALTLFQQKMTLYTDDEEITDPEKIARKICRGIGDEGLRRLNASGLTEEEKKVPDKIWGHFENTLKTNVNYRVHRLQLMQFRQRADENIDDFVNRTRTIALKCDFTNEELEERIIELIIASTPHEQLRRDLLSKDKKFPLKDTLTLARTYEAYQESNKRIEKLNNTDNHVNIVQRTRKCFRCDGTHQPRRCPAYNAVCDKCDTIGHYGKCCLKSRRQETSDQRQSKPRISRRPDTNWKPDRRNDNPRYRNTPRNKVDAVHEETTDESEEEETYDHVFYGIESKPKRSKRAALTNIDVIVPHVKGKQALTVKIDTGASANTYQ